MSVYTIVTDNILEKWLSHYSIGLLVQLQGIASGVTNTNYFVTTTNGRYVLTLFEQLSLDQLPFYLNLINHLSKNGVACPLPIANHAGQFATVLVDKPACLVSCLRGKDISDPSPAQCHAVGKMLSRMHNAGTSYPLTMENPRGSPWWEALSTQLLSCLTPQDQESFRIEIEYQRKQHFTGLPSGIIHADLFRDNVLMEGEVVTGFIDFYYACHGAFIYDIAIALNDWARQDDNTIDDARAMALLDGYQSIRLLTDSEKQAWPSMLRAAALRFWTSRLLDFYYPQPAALLHTKDPRVFQHLVETYRQQTDFWL